MCYVNEMKMLKDRKALLYKECFELEQEIIDFYSNDFEPKQVIGNSYYAPKTLNQKCITYVIKNNKIPSISAKKPSKERKKELDQELKIELDILHYSYDKKIRDINTKIANLGLNRAIIH